MNCKKARLILPLYFDSKLNVLDSRELEAHLKTCPECSAELEKIERLSGALNAISDVELPQSLAERLKPQTRLTTTHMYTQASRYFVVTRRRIFGLIMNTVYVSLLLIAVIIVFKLGFLDRFAGYEQQNISETTVTSESKRPEFGPPVTLKNLPKAKPVEPGAGELSELAGENFGSSQFPHPQVIVSGKNYSRKDADDAMVKPSVVEFTLNYTTKHVPYFKDSLAREIGSRARQCGEDGAVAQACVLSLLAKLDKPALPAYAEKARFEGKEVWLIVVTLSDGGLNSALSRASLFVMDPAQNSVIYTR